MACSSGVMPLYLTEISTPAQRKFVVSLFPLGSVLGNILNWTVSMDVVLGRWFSWHYFGVIALVFPISHLLFSRFIPESPAYLTNNGETQAAKLATLKLH